MSNTLSKLYQRDNFRLAKTMVIKHHGIAIAMNNMLKAKRIQVLEDAPETWRYYLHLSGEYHPSDTQMTIVNLDDPGFAEVVLTKDFIANNRITRESYQYGSRYFEELVKRYPEQESLILGMLYPVHINDALGAKDGDILWYDESLVEQWELNLIEETQAFIHNYLANNYIRDYASFNNLYTASALTTMYAFLPCYIIGLRLKNARTDMVHSYHVIQYLNSHLGLGKYVPYMRRRTMMFLYRNIRWIMRHAGKAYVFEKLIRNILDEHGIPLTAHDMIKTVQLPTDITDRVDYKDDPYPDVKILPYLITGDRDLYETTAFIEVETIIAELAKTKGYTPEQVTEFSSDIVWKMKPSNDNELKTKLFASEMTDETDSVHFPLAEVLARHWVYYASEDMYNANISFINPATGEQLIITTKDALILYVYLMCLYYNDMEAPTNLVKQYAINVMKPTSPTLAEISDIISVDDVDPDRLNDIINHDITVPAMTSTESFYNHCSEIQKFMMHQRYVYSSTMLMDEYAYLRNAAAMHYSNYEVDPGNVDVQPKTYADWLTEKSIVLDGLDINDVKGMADTIARLATGITETSNITLADIHTAMINIMRELSSYSVNYMANITNTNEFPLDWNFSRYSRPIETSNLTRWAEVPHNDIVGVFDHLGMNFDENITDEITTEYTIQETVYHNYPTVVRAEKDASEVTEVFMNVSSFSLVRDDFLIDLNNTPVTSVDEYEDPT